ncbi:flagellar biosynthesis anti-sigma factor FlgM [Pseudothermotoga sp. U03pept]|uniref:flagellar biosynthesis anti-sigma factor FlgM n=1 Tax=Pseudothermotoga sp. U03pept TaxID=3447012 RepID=UPI003F104DC8
MQEIGRVGGLPPSQQPLNVEKTEKKTKSSDASASAERSGSPINVIELIREARETPEVREKLVEEIKKALDQNIYNIDPERIAKHILREL